MSQPYDAIRNPHRGRSDDFRSFVRERSMARRQGNAAILGRKLEQMALEERVPGDAESWRSTPLGRELHSHLLMVFLGLWDEWEVPMILQDYGVIDDLECEAIWAAPAQRKKAPPKRGLEVGGPRSAIAGPRLKACRTRPQITTKSLRIGADSPEVCSSGHGAGRALDREPRGAGWGR